MTTESPTPRTRYRAPSKEGTNKYTQEKIMLGLAAVFFGGILAYTLIPEPYNGAASAVITFLTFYVMFKF